MRRYFDVGAYLQVLEQSSGISTCDPVPLPEIAKNQNYLFISYSHRDYKKVYAALAVMYHAGVRFWLYKRLLVWYDGGGRGEAYGEDNQSANP